MVTPMGLCSLGQVPVEPHAQVLPASPGVVSASPCPFAMAGCTGWVVRGQIPTLPPHALSCLLAGRAGASATHPLSLSINLLGKHSLEQGSLSVCLSMVVLPMSLTQALWISLCSAVCWDASPPLGLLPARQQCRQDPARAG